MGVSSKRFGLIDCNSFFASCEQLFRPALAHSAVIVLSNNDGCVIARSAEARKLGIRMGEPFFRIRRLCKNRGVSVFSSNFRLYGDMSRRVMQTLGQLVGEIEIYSIDEAFLDLTGMTDEAVCKITPTVARWTGIPTALGVGPTKTLAKAANRLAKLDGKTYCDLSDPANRKALLAQLPLADVWGIGRRLVGRFERLGCHNGVELMALDPIWVRHNFSIVQEQLIRELRGEPCLTVETEPAHRKNIQVSRSFGQIVSDRDTVAQATSTFVAKAAEKMRKEHGAAGGIYLFLSTGRYRQGPRYEGSTAQQFSTPAFSTHRILRAARSCFDEIWRDGYGYAKAGVILLDIRPFSANEVQRHLWKTDNESPEQSRLMELIDRLNRDSGHGAIRFGSESIAAAGRNEQPPTRPAWESQAAMRSPCYTTSWSDLPRVFY